MCWTFFKVLFEKSVFIDQLHFSTGFAVAAVVRLWQSLLPNLPRIARKTGRLKPEENILKQYWHISLSEKITSKCNKVYKVSFHFVF